MVTDTARPPATNTQTHRQDRLQYTAPLSLARSVGLITFIQPCLWPSFRHTQCWPSNACSHQVQYVIKFWRPFIRCNCSTSVEQYLTLCETYPGLPCWDSQPCSRRRLAANAALRIVNCATGPDDSSPHSRWPCFSSCGCTSVEQSAYHTVFTFRQQLKAFLFEQSCSWLPCYIALDTTCLRFNFLTL